MFFASSTALLHVQTHFRSVRIHVCTRRPLNVSVQKHLCMRRLQNVSVQYTFACADLKMSQFKTISARAELQIFRSKSRSAHAEIEMSRFLAFFHKQNCSQQIKNHFCMCRVIFSIVKRPFAGAETLPKVMKIIIL